MELSTFLMLSRLCGLPVNIPQTFVSWQLCRCEILYNLDGRTRMLGARATQSDSYVFPHVGTFFVASHLHAG